MFTTKDLILAWNFQVYASSLQSHPFWVTLYILSFPGPCSSLLNRLCSHFLVFASFYSIVFALMSQSLLQFTQQYICSHILVFDSVYSIEFALISWFLLQFTQQYLLAFPGLCFSLLNSLCSHFLVFASVYSIVFTLIP